jgi:hypothetical protein
MLFYNDELSSTLGLSVREIKTLVGYSSLYEFEDIIQSVGGANLLKVKANDYQALENSRKAYKAVRKVTKSRRFGDFISQHFISDCRFQLQKNHTLFIPTFNNLFELFALKSVAEWRDRSRYAACYINEVWEDWLQDKDCEYLIELLKDFDHIFVGLYHGVELLSELTGKPCTYLPIGVDALKFCPNPKQKHPRNIDICNIGRRSDITHRALLEMASQEDLFYYYDTISTGGVVNAAKQTTFNVKNPAEHRLLLSNLLKRSRYFIANRAFVNDPERTRGNYEIPSRFFEGAAAGTVMIGDAPNTEVFKEYFGWEDSVIRVAFDAPQIAEVIAELDAQPERVADIRRNNAINALLKHDWLHRLQAIYTTFDLPPSAEMMQRSAQISELVDQIHRLDLREVTYA